MLKVYLAGPIRGLSYNAAMFWRTEVADQLFQEGVMAYSPMRGKEALQDSKCLDERDLIGSDPVFTPKGIVNRDFNDVRTCDLMFVNLLNSARVSTGTMVEIGAACVLNKPIVLVMKKGNIHDHPFVVEPALYWVDDLDQAVELTKGVLLP